MSFSTPSQEEVEELLLCCRYGDLEDVQQFVQKYGSEPLSSVRDDRGNTTIHMASANGHLDLLEYLLPLVPSSLFSVQNDSQSTALHWASLNNHLPTVQVLVKHSNSPGPSLIDIKNKAGRTAVGEAEIMGREDVASWLVGQMLLDPEGDEKKLAETPTEEAAAGETDATQSQGGEDVEVDLFKLRIDANGAMDVSPADQTSK